MWKTKAQSYPLRIPWTPASEDPFETKKHVIAHDFALEIVARIEAGETSLAHECRALGSPHRNTLSNHLQYQIGRKIKFPRVRGPRARSTYSATRERMEVAGGNRGGTTIYCFRPERNIKNGDSIDWYHEKIDKASAEWLAGRIERLEIDWTRLTDEVGCPGPSILKRQVSEHAEIPETARSNRNVARATKITPQQIRDIQSAPAHMTSKEVMEHCLIWDLSRVTVMRHRRTGKK